MPYELGDVLPHGGRYRCLRCGDVVEWVTDELRADWCYVCNDPEVRWELVERLSHVVDPDLPLWAIDDQMTSGPTGRSSR